MFSFLSQSPATPPKQRVRSSQTSLQHPQSSVDAARCVKGSRLSRQANSGDRLPSGSRVKRALCASGAEDEYVAANTRKIATPFSEIAPSFPWLRSGRRFSHLAVVGAATMQVKSLRDFTRADADRLITPSSSARTPERATSQTSTASCLWTPEPPRASQTSLRRIRGRPRRVCGLRPCRHRLLGLLNGRRRRRRLRLIRGRPRRVWVLGLRRSGYREQGTRWRPI
ncbi:hypothetical protein PR003_g27642 [Phytophthora rubi]|uniref:Uncharacterized protein n=1 Tax=Phytophthora rubi TaxID=129364 RepID=A0A6A3IHC4_9STRA|nr:hypothetical protein PR001_g24520 [Phytophthora rubi]KAE9007399.1 hypothetical protein PR002_g16213 [Phytophthora rubi]KAE9281575.1 hypothetical protein PR003_g27642 [Phytophthora rubi]